MIENQAVENPNVTTANKTVNYGLPLWEKDDVTSYMNDMNAAMDIIDNTMHSNALVQHSVLETADDAKSTAEEAMEVANSFNERINNLVTQQTETSSAVEHLQTDVADNTEAIGNLANTDKSLDARVGANEEAIGTLGNKVDGMESSVADAVQKATSAETTAQTAETTATGAEETANAAKQEVEMLQTAVDNNTDDINRLGKLSIVKLVPLDTSDWNISMYAHIRDDYVLFITGENFSTGNLSSNKTFHFRVNVSDILPDNKRFVSFLDQLILQLPLTGTIMHASACIIVDDILTIGLVCCDTRDFTINEGTLMGKLYMEDI